MAGERVVGDKAHFVMWMVSDRDESARSAQTGHTNDMACNPAKRVYRL